MLALDWRDEGHEGVGTINDESFAELGSHVLSLLATLAAAIHAGQRKRYENTGGKQTWSEKEVRPTGQAAWLYYTTCGGGWEIGFRFWIADWGEAEPNACRDRRRPRDRRLDALASWLRRGEMRKMA